MKRLTVGLAVLLSGYAANSFAALPNGNSSRCDVCVPSYCGGFTFGLTGLYWRPTTDHLDYALTFPAVDTAGDPIFNNGEFHRLHHDYDWGFEANVGYVFPCSGNDVTLMYRHWDNSHHHHTRPFAAAFPTTVAPFFTFGDFLVEFPAVPITIATAAITTPVAIPATTIPTALPAFAFPFGPDDVVAISACSKFENNTWDLDFGQTINVGCNFRLRWFGGLRYTRLKHDFHVTTEFEAVDTFATDPILAAAVDIGGTVTEGAVDIFPVLDVIATLRDIACQKSDFDGVGPQFGFDATYHLGGGFGVVGRISTALLVGETESTYAERVEIAATATLDPVLTLVTTTVDFPVTAPLGTVLPVAGSTLGAPLVPIVDSEAFSFRHPDETRVVPNIDAKLGLDWTYQFCNCSRSKLTIEAGYMVSHYFNAIDRLSGLEAFAPEVRSRQALDVSFDGPYVGVQVTL